MVVGWSVLLSFLTDSVINAPNIGDKTPKTTPSHIDNSLDLLSDCDSIIRVSTKIEKSSPHIHMRCNGADGLSITQALCTKYTHINHPKKEFMYKKNDIK